MKRSLLGRSLATLLLFTACADPASAPPESPAVPAGAPEASLLDGAATNTQEVIVNYDPAATSASALSARLQELGVGVIRFRNLSMLAALATPVQVTAIDALPGVQGVTVNRVLRPLLHEGLTTIRADAVHADGITGRGVGIAILDSGVDGAFSPDVAYPGRTVQNVKYVAASRDLYSTGDGVPYVAADLFVERVPNSETSMGHGTHVAGIAAGDGTASTGWYTGVAPGANLVGIGAGETLFIFWILAGFDYILEHQQDYNIQVVNNSWGSSGAFDPDDPINEATRALHDRGITVVFAAGNEGPGENTLNPYSVAPWVIGVAAGCKSGDDPTGSAVHCADQTGAGRASVLADFSSRGIPGDPLYHPDVTAPGVHIVSTRAATGTLMNLLDANHDLNLTSSCAIAAGHAPYYTCASGTSMAAPVVAGVVALMEEASGGRLTPDDAAVILTRTARRLEGYAAWEVGDGVVDALAAVRAARRGRD